MRWLEFFAGAGGAALGIRAAGGEAVACVEWDGDACSTLRAAGFPAVKADVVDYIALWGMTAPWLLPGQMFPIPRAEGPIGGVWASFPCQPWSSAGDRLGEIDERNGWPWVVDALDAVQPTWLVAENVEGLTFHRQACKGGKACTGECARAYLDQVIVPELKERFDVVEWRVLDAHWYGVPQFRKRIIIIAGPAAIEWPPATHQNPSEGSGLLPWVTFGEALGLHGDVGTSQRTEKVRGEREPYLTTSERPSPSVRTRGDQLYVLARPSVAITTTDGTGIGSAASRDAIEKATGRRSLTTTECATLQGFPPDHPWRGGSTAIYRQIGNAVPPRLAAVVAGAVEVANGV